MGCHHTEMMADQLRKCPDMGDFWCLIFIRDELHSNTIKAYLEEAGVTNKTEFDQLLSKYQQIII